jgi:hypothetical protein
MHISPTKRREKNLKIALIKTPRKGSKISPKRKIGKSSNKP